MLKKYIRSLNKEVCPVVLSVTDSPIQSDPETVIKRNHIGEPIDTESTEIYYRAREIFYRARTHRPVRAASIF